MKLLYITPVYPDPPLRGYTLLAFHEIRMLSERHSIDLISFDTADGDPGGRLDAYCERIDRLPLSRAKAIRNALTGTVSRRPFQVSYFESREMKRFVEERLRSESYDVVVVYLTRMAQFLPEWYRGSAVLIMVDAYALNYERSLSWRPFYLRHLLRSESSRLKQYESKLSSRFTRLLLVSQRDVEDYAPMLSCANLGWFPYAVDTDYFIPAPKSNREPGSIVMTGSMFYAPNVDAVNFFCEQVFPIVRRRIPWAKLWVVGSRPAKSVRQWGNGRDIEVTGFVEDVRTYLNRAMVSVCPMRLPAAMQTKLLEALATGTPVVSTSAGNHGTGGNPGHDLLVADSPTEFADAVCGVLEGKDWQRLSENARKFVLDRYTWEAHAREFEKILIEAAETQDSPHTLEKRPS